LGLVLALVLVGIGVGFRGGDDDRSHVSDNPEALELCDKGTAAMQAFKLRDAVRILGRCLELDPELAEASISRAAAFARLGESDNFTMELARADSLTGLIDHDRRRMRAQLRLSGFKPSKYRAMRDSVLAVLEQEIPNDLDVLEAMAGNAGMTGTPEDVIQAWKKILEVNPNHAVAYNMLGYTEMYRGNYPQAIEYLQKYAFLAPDLANPHDSLGEVYMVTGRYEEARDEFVKSVEMQPDFYHSIINLGKVYLARGQLDKGLSIMEKVRAEVKGSNLEQKVDQEIIGTYLIAGLEEDLARTVTDYIARYPKSDVSAFYRAVSLAYMGRFMEGRAVMDSSLAAWREDETYQLFPAYRAFINRREAEFEAIAADVAHDHQSSELHWGRARELFGDKTPVHERWYTHYRYAAALHANGKAREALKVIDPLLSANKRIIPLLILKIHAHIDLKEGESARTTLAQLQRSLKFADEDFPARDTATELEVKVSSLAMN
jgi:Flp pilus assembly protein TadD